MGIQVTINSFGKKAHKVCKMESNPIDRRKKIYSSVSKYFRRWITTAFPREASPSRIEKRTHRSRSRGQPYLYPSRLCTSLFPGARTPTVPSPSPTSARSPLLQQRLVQASGTERDRTVAISVAISLPPRRIRAFRYPVRQQEQCDRRLMRYLRATYILHLVQRVHTRRVARTLAASLFYLALSNPRE